jgi:hypothetical protein
LSTAGSWADFSAVGRGERLRAAGRQPRDHEDHREQAAPQARRGLWVSDTPTLDLIGPLPDGVTRVDAIESAAVAVLRAESRAVVDTLLDAHGDRLAALPVLWVLYPKGNRADINRDSPWPLLVPHGLRPITQIAVDDVWSALRFRALKEGERQLGDKI